MVVVVLKMVACGSWESHWKLASLCCYCFVSGVHNGFADVEENLLVMREVALGSRPTVVEEERELSVL